MAAQAHLSLLQYSLGAAVWTAPRVGERGARKALAALPTDRYATMVSLAVELADAGTTDDQYPFGLDLLLTALRQQLAAT